MPEHSVSLLFIPDISGFTNFIHQTELRHSQHIISELLEILIDANELDMELAEIEGDALFFYKFKSLPDYTSIVAQIKKLYLVFHHHLKLYEFKRICQCGACTTANNLELKFVVHSGDFNFINVKGQHKPIGESVITVHRLLKNDIPLDEYVLISENTRAALNLDLDSTWKMLESNYDHIGNIKYSYREISSFKKELPRLPEIVIDNVKKQLHFSTETEISQPPIYVYELLSNFKFRRLWNTGLDDLKYDDSELNQSDVKHTCVIDGKSIDFETVKKKGQDGQWVYGEQTLDIPFMNKATTYYVLKTVGNSTNLRIEVYFEPNGIIGYILFPLIKKKLNKSIEDSIVKIKEIADKFSLEDLYVQNEQE